jgi:predicted  nucleic acid-binding Zn-ribbon protein
MDGSLAFQRHLDGCAQCAGNPFEMCATGRALLRAAVDEDERDDDDQNDLPPRSDDALTFDAGDHAPAISVDPASARTDDDQHTAGDLAQEIFSKLAQPMEITFNPVTVFQLTGLLQLALRHPELTPELRATGARFVGAVCEYFADCPTILDTIRRGDDPAEDRPWKRE